MGTPGSGRYTTYLPVKSPKLQRLLNMFKGGFSALYKDKESNADAAKEAVAIAKSVLDGKGDSDMFGVNVDLSYGSAQDTAAVKWANAGDPANPYVPDISSPGPGKTEGSEKNSDPALKPEDINPKFNPATKSVNTESPTTTSNRLGTTSLGENLSHGKSSIK